MHIILGGTGHVGSATALSLLKRGEPVTIVTRNGSKAETWRARGAGIAIADVHDTDALRTVFQRGRRLFLLNPPADPKTDTDAEERSTIASILAALKGSGLEKVVAESTYGAQPGERCGDLNTLHELEEGLRAQPIAASIIRAAYYMSNWDALLPVARQSGTLPTMYPEDLQIPMVAPNDIGQVAARLMTEPVEQFALHHVEGPARYSCADVAGAMTTVLGVPVRPVVTPRNEWASAYEKLGFSAPAAASYARMTAITVDGAYDMPKSPERGLTTLEDYMADLLAHDGAPEA